MISSPLQDDLFFIGNSKAARFVRDMVARVANSAATVLITGESGTGKELVARSLHAQSNRRTGNFVPINCAAIPKDLIESELFGHRKGAFTGAIADRVGRFELAHGGTIFLDEIGDLSLDAQVKLLRVLQERTVDPVGGSRPVQVDVRVLAATHRNLESEIVAGRFREDLYYRLNVVPIQTPPLRERSEDLPEFLPHFGRHFATPGSAPISFSADFLDMMKAYHWPGNVRELANFVNRLSTLFASQEITLPLVPPHLLPKGLALLQAQRCELPTEVSLPKVPAPAEPHQIESVPQHPVSPVEEIIFLAQGGFMGLPSEGISLKERLADIERDFISQALSRTDGNVSQTARLLNLQRTTLIEKINKYALRPSLTSNS